MFDPKKVYVGNVVPSMSKEVLQEHFSQYGKVEEVSRPVNPFKKEPYNYGFIMFSKPETVTQLIKQGSSEVGEIRLEIRPAKIQEKKPIRPYLAKKRKHSSSSSSTQKKSQAWIEKFYEEMSSTTLKLSVFPGQTYHYNIVKMELWL